MQSGSPHKESTGWRTLLDPATRTPRWGIAESLVMLLWFALTSFAVAQHVPWADEAQAWLLAADAGWKTLFLHSLHYEGSGGLWHAFLKVLQTCRVPFTGMRWIVMGIEGAAMAMLLRYAPFPRLLRFLLPFTFFLLYQDAVVARSYCLFAVLAFPAAVLLRGKRPRPLFLALLLGLMANISVHAAVASLGLAAVAAWAWRGRLFRSVPAMMLLLLLWIGNVVTMAPAFDIDFGTGNNLLRSVAKVENHLGIPAVAPPPLTGQTMANLPQTPVPVHVRHGFAKTWNKVSRVVAVITYPLAASRALALLLVSLVAAQAWAQRRIQPGESTAAGKDARQAKASTGKDAALLGSDAESLGLLGLAPYGLMVAVFASLYLAPRHAGTVLTVFVVTAWLTWPSRTGLAGNKLVLERITAGVFIVVCMVQIGWSAHAIARERTLPYGPGRMTAEYLKSRGVGDPVAGEQSAQAASGAAVSASGASGKLAGFYYLSIDPLLYFNRNLYFNQPPHRYWPWSTAMRSYKTVQQVLADHPAFIVVGGYDNGPDAEITRDWVPVTPRQPGVVLNDAFGIARYFGEHGYHPTHVFCGHSWMRSTYAEVLCNTVLEPVRVPAHALPYAPVENQGSARSSGFPAY